LPPPNIRCCFRMLSEEVAAVLGEDAAAIIFVVVEF
jgi:hypothetical protein